MYFRSILFLFMGMHLCSLAQVWDVCADRFGGGGSHIIANVDKRNKVTLKWFPVEPLTATYNEGAETFRLVGQVYPQKRKGDPNTYMDVDITFREPREYTDCFCASPELQGSDWLDPDYKKLQRECTPENYMDYINQVTGDELLFCPKCEGNLCKRASKKNNAPQPVYADWDFFTVTEGGFSGPGVQIFREEVVKHFYPLSSGQGPPDTDICTFNFQRLPLPQLGCSDFADPGNGFGYGVNGKNMDCGMSAWFYCGEDVALFGPADFGIHHADINLNIVPCPTLPPTGEQDVLCDCIADTQENCNSINGIWVGTPGTNCRTDSRAECEDAGGKWIFS